MNPIRLPLHEELLLLALRDEKGTVAAASSFEFVLGAALVAELLLQGRVRIDPSTGKKKLVDLVDRRPMDDELLAESLSRMQSAKRRASLKSWVSRLAGLKKLKQRTAESLCRRGILRMEEGKVLAIFTRRVYPQIDARPEREIVERLRRAIFSQNRELDPRTATLVSLAHRGEVLKNLFDKQQLRSRKDRLKQISEGELTGAVAKELMDAVNAALVAAVVVTTAASN